MPVTLPESAVTFAGIRIVDESMLAFPRTSQLPKSVDTSEALIFVSDVDQLASVGPGQFPADLLD